MTDSVAVKTPSRLIELNAKTIQVGAQPAGVWLLGLAFWFATSVVLPVLGSKDFLETVSTTAGFLCFVTLQFSAIRLTTLLLAGHARYMAINFWVFVYLFFGISALVQVDYGIFPRHQDYVGGGYAPRDLATAQIIVLVGCIAYELGSYLVRQRTTKRFFMAPRQISISLPALHAFALISCVAGALYIARAGTSIIGARDSIQNFDSAAVNYVTRMLLFATAFLICYAYRRGQILQWRSLSRISQGLFILCVALCLLLNNPSTTQRGVVSAVFGGLAVASVRVDSKRIVRLLIIGLIGATILVYPLLNETFRRSDRAANQVSVVEPGVFGALRSSDTDFGMYTQIADGIEYVRVDGYSNGSFLASSLLVFIPRSIWTSKSFDVGDTVHDRLGYDSRYNYSSPLWMESFVEGGYIWLSIVLLALGAFSMLLDLHYLKFPVGRLAIITPAIAFYQGYLLRGSLMASLPMLYVMVVVFLLIVRRPRVIQVPESELATVARTT